MDSLIAVTTGFMCRVAHDLEVERLMFSAGQYEARSSTPATSGNGNGNLG